MSIDRFSLLIEPPHGEREIVAVGDYRSARAMAKLRSKEIGGEVRIGYTGLGQHHRHLETWYKGDIMNDECCMCGLRESEHTIDEPSHCFTPIPGPEK